MRREAKIEMCRAYIDSFNDAGGDADRERRILEETIHPESQLGYEHMSHLPAFSTGADGILEGRRRWRDAFSNSVQKAEGEAHVDGDVVVFRYSVSGTHTGLLKLAGGVAPTGKEVRLTGVVIITLKDDKVFSVEDYPNFVGLLQQLGVVAPSIP